MSQSDDMLIGRRLGSYEIIEAIGQGGMARVYKGYHEELDRFAAIKVIIWGLAEDQDFTKRFRREAQAIASLRHSNVVTIYDFGKYDHGYYLVMEYIEGEDLEAQIARGSSLSSSYIQKAISDVAAALDYAHKRGVIHRDVKPSNIMLSREGDAILTDFGLALLPSTMGSTTLGTSMGTPYYMAPEQAASSSSAVAESDIYSLGVILFELISGTPPYVADNPLGVALKHVSDPVPNIQDFVPGTPDAVKAVIDKAMAKDIEDRFKTASEMAETLAQAWGEIELKSVPVAVPLPVNVPPPITPPPVLPPIRRPPTLPPPQSSLTWQRQPSVVWGTLVGLLLVILSIGVGLSLRQTADPGSANVVQVLAMGSADQDNAADLANPVGNAADDTTTNINNPETQSNDNAPSIVVDQPEELPDNDTNTPGITPTFTAQPTLLPTSTITPTLIPTPIPTQIPTSIPTPIPRPTNTPTTSEILSALQGKILFKTDRSGRVEIYQMNIDGSDQKPLGADLAYLYNEAVRWESFSPNRQEVMVVRGEGQVDLWYVDLLAGVELRITDDRAPDYDPVWSPLEGDNRVVFVSERTGRGDLYLLDLDGSGVTRLTSNEEDFDKHPSWSQDGKQIVYWSDDGWQKNQQIWLLDLETKNRVSLSNNPYNDWDPLLVKIRQDPPDPETASNDADSS